MTRTELAQAMLDGSLGYRPTDDAAFMAQGYLNLVELVQRTKKHLPEGEQAFIDEFLSVDPARKQLRKS